MICISHPLSPKLRKHCRVEKFEEAEDQEVCCEIVFSVYNREAAHMKSRQSGHLNKTCTMTIPVDMLTWMKEICHYLKPR